MCLEKKRAGNLFVPGMNLYDLFIGEALINEEVTVNWQVFGR